MCSPMPSSMCRSLSGGGALQLRDAGGQGVDTLGWGKPIAGFSDAVPAATPVDGASLEFVIVAGATGRFFRADLLTNAAHRLIGHLPNSLPSQVQQSTNLLKSHLAFISNIESTGMLQLTNVGVREVYLQCPRARTHIKV